DVRREHGRLDRAEGEHEVQRRDEQHHGEHHELDQGVALLATAAGPQVPQDAHQVSSSMARPCTSSAPAGPYSPTSGKVARTRTSMTPSSPWTAVTSVSTPPPSRSSMSRRVRSAPSSGVL